MGGSPQNTLLVSGSGRVEFWGWGIAYGGVESALLFHAWLILRRWRRLWLTSNSTSRQRQSKCSHKKDKRRQVAANFWRVFDEVAKAASGKLRYGDRDAVLRSGYSIFLVATSRWHQLIVQWDRDREKLKIDKLLCTGNSKRVQHKAPTNFPDHCRKLWALQHLRSICASLAIRISIPPLYTN